MKELTQEYKDMIGKIAKEHSHRVFGFLDNEDLESEIWIICIGALEEYDPKIGKLEHFLRRAVKTRLVNCFKSITKSVRSPCPRCPEYLTTGKYSCRLYKDEKDKCNKWRNYQLSINSRNSLLNAVEEQGERSYNISPLNKMISEEIKEIVLKNIGADFLNDFKRFISGQKVTQHKFYKLINEVKRIVGDSGFDISEDI